MRPLRCHWRPVRSQCAKYSTASTDADSTIGFSRAMTKPLYGTVASYTKYVALFPGDKPINVGCIIRRITCHRHIWITTSAAPHTWPNNAFLSLSQGLEFDTVSRQFLRENGLSWKITVCYPFQTGLQVLFFISRLETLAPSVSYATALSPPENSVLVFPENRIMRNALQKHTPATLLQAIREGLNAANSEVIVPFFH